VTTSAIRLFVRFLRDDRGQDLIEYGLLASIIAVAGALLFPVIADKMKLNFFAVGSQREQRGGPK